VAPGDFVYGAGGCNLSTKGRRALVEAYERRLDQETTHPVFGYQLSMRRLLHVQARLLARFLLGEIASFPHIVPR
jgi:CRISPR-associated exonuclease Cas4/CRISPR-associated protein Cas1